jgi:hypothetical protein
MRQCLHIGHNHLLPNPYVFTIHNYFLVPFDTLQPQQFSLNNPWNWSLHSSLIFSVNLTDVSHCVVETVPASWFRRYWFQIPAGGRLSWLKYFISSLSWSSKHHCACKYLFLS